MSNEQILKNTNAKLLNEFNSSIFFDKELYTQDIKASLAHSLMLSQENIISNDEYAQIKSALNKIEKEIEEEKFVFLLEDEDIHMAIENRLTTLIGETGKKLHTARSRNDQVVCDFTLYVQEKSLDIQALLKNLIETFVNVARKHTDTLIPGMTHLQHAQAVNFGYHLLTYANMFKRDYERFQSSYERNNFSPLGSAALAGTPHKINRNTTSSLLGFKAPSSHAMDSVSNRDFALEILFNIATSMMHVSRISEELIMWSSYEFKFIKLSDEYSTTSSIMPQKKNPDVPELLRGKTGRVYGNLFSLFTIMKALPLAYNKDTQEDKEGVFDSVKTINISLKILNEIIKTMEINKNNMANACKVGHLSATDLADYLVDKKNIAFRDAYYITKDVVKYANSLNKDISELNLKELQEACKELENIDEEIIMHLDLKTSMNSRTSKGGASTQSTKEQIKEFEKWLDDIK